jgi:hypothetical protein
MSPLSPLSNGILDVNPNIVPLASTLLDTDIEKTTLRKLSLLSQESQASAARPLPYRGKASISTVLLPLKPSLKASKNRKASSKLLSRGFDEAFIDFWSDSLLDPISANWPTFIICKFKSSLVSDSTRV